MFLPSEQRDTLCYMLLTSTLSQGPKGHPLVYGATSDLRSSGPRIRGSSEQLWQLTAPVTGITRAPGSSVRTQGPKGHPAVYVAYKSPNPGTKGTPCVRCSYPEKDPSATRLLLPASLGPSVLAVLCPGSPRPSSSGNVRLVRLYYIYVSPWANK